MMQPYRILSLDGGGARGLIQLQVLKKLEAISGRKTIELFDHIAGTSVGGILACAFAATGDTAAQVEAMLLKLLPTVFKPSFLPSFVVGLMGPKYDAAKLEAALAGYLPPWGPAGPVPPPGLPKLTPRVRLTIPTFDLTAFEPLVIREDSVFTWRQITRMTSAAPTYFAPASVGGRAYWDGGVWANNPSVQALLDAERAQGSEARAYALLSIGTGAPKFGWTPAEASSWGSLGTIQPVLDVFTDGSVLAAHRETREAFQNPALGDYLRLQPVIEDDISAMDQADPEKLARLMIAGQTLADGAEADLVRFSDLLVQS